MKDLASVHPVRADSSDVPSDLALKALRESESRYRRQFQTAQDGILLLNADTAQIDDVNPYLIDMLGYSHAEFLGKKLWEIGAFADIAQSKEMFADLQTHGYARYKDLPLKTKTGVIVPVEFVSNSYDCDGIKVIQCNIRNISERHADRAKIQRHKHLYAALSQCNKAIVHCASEEELFLQICRAAVQSRAVRMAWVGLIDPETHRVRSAASCGDATEYLKDLNISVDSDSPSGRGPTGTAISKSQPVWCQDFLNDQATAPWHERAARAGLAASASLPLHRNGIVVGAFTVYSDEVNAFDKSARDLLIEMAADISFALGNLFREYRRQQAEEEIVFKNTILQTQQETSLDGILVIDANGQIISYNQQFVELWRLSPQQLSVGLSSAMIEAVAELVENSKAFVDRIQYLNEHREGKSREEISLKDGRTIDQYSAPMTGTGNKHYGRVWYFRDITERKQGAQRMRQQAERLTTTLESITDAFFTVDERWRFTFLNREAERLLARTRAELTGRDLWTEFPGAIGSTFERKYRQAMVDNKTAVFEEFYPPLNTWFCVRAYPSEQGLAVYFRDINDAKRIDQEIKFKNAVLQTQQETSLDGILLVDEVGQIISYNQQFIELWGLSPLLVSARQDAPVLQAVIDQVEDSASFVDRVQYLYEHRKNKSREEISLKDGRVIDRYSAPVSGADDNYYGRVWYFRDITERKHSERQVRDSEKRFRTIFDQAPIAIALLDMQGFPIISNSPMSSMVGYSNDELSRMSFRQFTYPEDVDKDLNQFSKLVEGKISAYRMEKRYVHKNGNLVWANLFVTILRDENGLPQDVLGIAEDITERKRAEISIKRLNRVYAVLSGINAVIVRVRDRDELFREACRIAVEQGGFRMSLIAIVNRTAMKIEPVASAGKDEELLTAIKGILSSSDTAPNTMTARAIREKKVIVSNDSQNDPRVLFGKLYADAGVRSMAVLPLVVSDEAVGVLVLYASEIEFFHEDELRLLTELAGDIAFAIDHIEKQTRLDYLAYYDALTGLANRRLFLERLAQHMRSAAAGGHKLAIALIDLERFKNINDSLGRSAGDALLRQVAEWLKQSAGDASLLARVDADHFAVVRTDIQSKDDLAQLVDERIEAFLQHPFRLDGAIFRVAFRAGVALFPDDGADADTLFKNAEAALKKAKASGERYLFYTQKMTEAVAGKLNLENQLRQALDKGEFVLHYQPKVNLASGKITSAEALIRWNDPRTGLVPPGRFIPILEETGMIYEVGRWALRQAIEDYLRWRAAGLAAVRIAVNVSPLQLRNRGFIAEIEQVIGVDEHAAAGLELEITESLIMTDVKHSIISLQAIRAMGVTIAIDDFGTGFSSLSYLAKLPVDTLKIDRSFVVAMTADAEGLALVSTIISLAHVLKLKVVAEGVETEEQARLLRVLNCDEMQGYLFSKAVPSDIFETRFLFPMSAG